MKERENKLKNMFNNKLSHPGVSVCEVARGKNLRSPAVLVGVRQIRIRPNEVRNQADSVFLMRSVSD